MNDPFDNELVKHADCGAQAFLASFGRITLPRFAEGSAKERAILAIAKVSLLAGSNPLLGG
jgi:hypothetical protein